MREGIWGGIYHGATQQCAFLCIAPAECELSERTKKCGKDISYVLSRLDEDVYFVLHYVDSNFYPKSNFSSLEFVLNTYTTHDGVAQAAISPSTLFSFEPRLEYHDVMQFIRNSRSCPWPPLLLERKSSEQDVMIAIASHILRPLCREVILEISYTKALQKRPVPGLEARHIGMGSLNTWHGSPDARVRGTEVVFRRETDETYEVSQIPSDNESDASDGATTCIETKIMAKDANLHQAIGTCVVASFTEKTLHPNMTALVPTVLIDKTQFRVILYDCQRDILLISTSKCLATKDTLSQSGMALLWLTLNHR